MLSGMWKYDLLLELLLCCTLVQISVIVRLVLSYGSNPDKYLGA